MDSVLQTFKKSKSSGKNPTSPPRKKIKSAYLTIDPSPYWKRIGFTVLNNRTIFDPWLTNPAKLLLIMLVAHSFGKGEARISQKTLARELKVTPRWVIKLLAELETKGRILKIRIGQGHCNDYKIQHAPLRKQNGGSQNQGGSELQFTSREELQFTQRSKSYLNKSQVGIEEKLVKFLGTQDKIRAPEALIKDIKNRYGAKYLPKLMEIEVNEWYSYLDHWKKLDAEQAEMAKANL